ncbi:MAG: tripartite tricarboxylate transporter substrate binding protein [Burkholderiales bacterium]|nr:tripartite tricarboxylate transporter substrate binding protein [Burkholderiales bacterium]
MSLRHLMVAALAAFALNAHAAWPEKTVKIIVPWAPGGSTDILARTVADKLSKSLGQPVVVDNKPGASGNMGSDMVAKAAPDGYTLLFGSMSTHAINPGMMPAMPFKGVEDFTPIAMLAFVTNTMVIHPSLPVSNVKEFIAYAKANPGKVAFASAGNGSTNHLSAALLEKMAGIQMLHVPYKGGAPAVVATVAGETQVLFTAGTQSLPHVKAGKLKLLAVTEKNRSSLLKDTPTVAETVPGYEMAVWYGAFGPKGMPPEIQKRLNAEINAIMMSPEVKTKMEAIGVEPVNDTPEQFAATLRADAEKWGKLVQELRIVAE